MWLVPQNKHGILPNRGYGLGTMLDQNYLDGNHLECSFLPLQLFAFASAHHQPVRLLRLSLFDVASVPLLFFLDLKKISIISIGCKPSRCNRPNISLF